MSLMEILYPKSAPIRTVPARKVDQFSREDRIKRESPGPKVPNTEKAREKRTLESLTHHNEWRALVLKLLRERGTMTRASLRKEAGISSTTISRVVRGLEAQGKVVVAWGVVSVAQPEKKT